MDKRHGVKKHQKKIKLKMDKRPWEKPGNWTNEAEKKRELDKRHETEDKRSDFVKPFVKTSHSVQQKRAYLCYPDVGPSASDYTRAHQGDDNGKYDGAEDDADDNSNGQSAAVYLVGVVAAVVVTVTHQQPGDAYPVVTEKVAPIARSCQQ